MSDKAQPREVGCNGGGGGGGGGNSGADDEDSDGPTEMGDPKDKKWKGCWKKCKRPSLFRLRKGKKLLQQKKKQKGIYVNSGCWWRKMGRRRRGGGYCCLKRPRTVDSSGESPTSDPNSPEFTFDMLKTLIEKNDFYSKECNPHLDTDD